MYNPDLDDALLHPSGNPRLEGPRLQSNIPIRRQLAPIVGPKASGVTFQAGTLGRIGESIAVGRAVNIDGNVYINCDNILSMEKHVTYQLS